jgi:hypothetical protein
MILLRRPVRLVGDPALHAQQVLGHR